MDEERRAYSGQTGEDESREAFDSAETERNEETPVSADADTIPRENTAPVYETFSLYGSEDEKQWTPPQADAAPTVKTKQKKPSFPWKTLGKTAAIAVFGLMIVFSTATSAYLLKDHLSAENTVAQIKETNSSAKEDNVTQTSSSGEELSVTEINAKVASSVVLITGTNMYGSGQGTGMIISDDGYILTNAHVVKDFSQLNVTLNDENQTKYEATMVGYDDTTDLAVIKIDADGLTPVTFGTSADLEVGESVVVIGNPLGEEFSGSVTTGIVSALNRKVEFDDGQVYTYIQTDAAINSGNSGGPLVNMSGQVIGINSAKIDSSIAEGMGFAIPIDIAVPVINDLIENGYVTNRPYIGISGETIDEQYSKYYSLPQGVHVVSIASGSPAANSDLQVDDIITAINDTAVTSIGELNNIKNQYSPGDTVSLTVYRHDTQKTLTIKITLSEMTSDMQ
ncbi:MAG TPA: trypsin-like peptidase domain-containing protein [Clostridiales bacterium]|nr:trypsin-like peptidase domain-containing protein [Clostridiales bacterium]